MKVGLGLARVRATRAMDAEQPPAMEIQVVQPPMATYTFSIDGATAARQLLSTLAEQHAFVVSFIRIRVPVALPCYHVSALHTVGTTEVQSCTMQNRKCIATYVYSKILHCCSVYRQH